MFHFLQLFFFFVFVVVFFLLNPHLLLITSASDDYYCNWSEIHCPNNGEWIQYPFYLIEDGTDYEYYCGYLGLSAQCSQRGKPFSTLSNNSFYYQPTLDPRSFQVRDVDIADQTCPQPRHNFSLDVVVASSTLIYGSDPYVTFFYNCSALPEDAEPNLPCIDQNNNYTGHSFAMETARIPVGFNWYAHCQRKVTLPVSHIVTNYTQEIKSGFYIELQPSEECRTCEKSGGKCALTKASTSFRCNCGSKVFIKQCPEVGNNYHSKHVLPHFLT